VEKYLPFQLKYALSYQLYWYPSLPTISQAGDGAFLNIKELKAVVADMLSAPIDHAAIVPPLAVIFPPLKVKLEVLIPRLLPSQSNLFVPDTRDSLLPTLDLEPI